MSEFASQNDCHEILDGISELIIASNGVLHVVESGERGQGFGDFRKVPVNPTPTRYGRGESRGGVSDYQRFPHNSEVPMRWHASLDEPYVYRNPRGSKIVGIQHTQAVNHTSFNKEYCPEYGQFDVYGLKVYGPSDDWNNIKWSVLQPLAHAQEGELGIFLGGLGLAREAVVESGHAIYDEDEEQRLDQAFNESGALFRYDNRGEPTAHKNSLRLTDRGAEFLSSILWQTQAFELSLNIFQEWVDKL